MLEINRTEIKDINRIIIQGRTSEKENISLEWAVNNVDIIMKESLNAELKYLLEFYAGAPEVYAASKRQEESNNEITW